MTRFSAVMALALFAAIAQHAAALTFLTEENPPLNFTRNGQVTGAATATVQEMLKRAGLAADIRVMAWDQAYAQAQSDPATCIYATARLPERYNLFQWIGPIARGVYSAFALEGFKDKIGSAGELFKYRIGVARDARAQYLRRRGFTNLVEVDKDEDVPAMLTLNPAQQGGVDIWVTQAEMARDIVRKAGGSPVKQVFAAILSQEYWLACNPKLPPEQVRALSDALSGINIQGTAPAK